MASLPQLFPCHYRVGASEAREWRRLSWRETTRRPFRLTYKLSDNIHVHPWLSHVLAAAEVSLACCHGFVDESERGRTGISSSTEPNRHSHVRSSSFRR